VNTEVQGLNKSKLIELLAGELPGKEVQYRMAPKGRTVFSIDENCREAAVLILIYSEDDQFRIVFIKRNEYDGPHSGQVSFPGGMKELSDKDFSFTALRETEEETGVLSSRIEVLGALSPLFIPVSNFCVHPFVGWLDDKPDFVPDKTEVQYLICPTINRLIDPKNKKLGSFNRHGVQISTPYIDIDGEMIWGATAMMLGEFISLIGY
jgi:hypothetical protein